MALPATTVLLYTFRTFRWELNLPLIAQSKNRLKFWRVKSKQKHKSRNTEHGSDDHEADKDGGGKNSDDDDEPDDGDDSDDYIYCNINNNHPCSKNRILDKHESAGPT